MKIEIVDSSKITWPQLKALRLEALKLNPTSFGRSYEETLVHTDEDWKDRLKSHQYYFAQCNEELVGMISYYRHTGEKTSHLFGVCAFYVKPDYQGKGIGRQLLKKTLETIQSEPAARKVKIFGTVGNDPATELYKSMDFNLVGIQKDELLVNGQFYDEMEFEMIFN